MKLKVVLDEGAYMPEKAHEEDAGFDLRTPIDITIKGGNHAFIDTGVHIEIPEFFAGMLKSKSGLNCKHNIVSEGVIDTGYTGSIGVKLYNHGREDYHFKRGDKVTQLVFVAIGTMKNDDLHVVKHLDETERGDGGFGSTGK